MSNELELAIELDQSNLLEVIRLDAESKTPTEIQNLTGIPMRKQREYREQWKSMVTDPRYIEQRSHELVSELDEAYRSILRRLESTYEQAVEADDYKSQKEILKEMANVRKMSTEMFMKVGLVSKDSVGDVIAESEQKIADVINVLREIATEMPEAGKLIQQKLAELDGKSFGK